MLVQLEVTLWSQHWCLAMILIVQPYSICLKNTLFAILIYVQIGFMMPADGELLTPTLQYETKIVF